MALAGSLKEFGLADILQLISYQKKTGNLTLTARTETVRLLFSDGYIVSAETSRKRTRDRLGRVLIRKGLLKEEELAAVIDEQKEKKETRVKLGTLLLRKGLATQQQIQSVLSDQITEVVVNLFTWTVGKYEFTPVAVPVDKEIQLKVDAQGLLMESLRILDEWSVFKDRITQETVLRRTAKPTGGLSAEQAEMLTYVDGKNDTTVVAELYGLDAFEGAKILLKLLESGYVEPRRNVPGPSGSAPDKRPAEIPGLAFIIGLIAVIALALSIFAHVIGVSYSTENIKASEALDRLRFELEVKKHQTGTYPASVAETDPWGSNYVVKTTMEGLVIFSPGPDRTANTLDDIY